MDKPILDEIPLSDTPDSERRVPTLPGLGNPLTGKVAVKITNDYSDGHHSESTAELDAPTAEYLAADPELASWFEEVVFEHTGDGHGTSPDLGSCYTAKIVEADDASLVGLEYEWID